MARLGKRVGIWLALLGVALVAIVTATMIYANVGSGTYRAEDFVGTWQMDGPEGSTATLSLSDDGTARVSGVPRIGFRLAGPSTDVWSKTLTSAGGWKQIDADEIYLITDDSTIRMTRRGWLWGDALDVVGGLDADSGITYSFHRVSDRG